jgi:hypothetical protein
MARKRMIHRDLWQSYDIAKCSYRQRLLFIGLITIADDEGRLKAEETILQGEIFPYDNLSRKLIKSDLEYLDSLELIKYYRMNCIEKYVQITNWKNYQKIDHPQESKIPEYSQAISKSIRETLANNSRNYSENFSPNYNSNSNYNPKENSEKVLENSVNKSKKPKLSGKEAYNFATGVKKEKEYIETIKKPQLQERMLTDRAKDCYKVCYDLGEPCKKQDKPECKLCLPIQAKMKAELDKLNKVPDTYAQCENFILKNCYVKDHGTKPKYDFCYKCAKDDIWGINKGKW